LVGRLIAEEPYAVGDAERGRVTLERGAVGPVTRQDQLDGRVIRGETGQGVKQEGQPFDGCEAAGEEQAVAARAMRTRRELRRVDAAVDDVHSIPAFGRRPDQHLAAAEVADAGDEERPGELGVQSPPRGREEDVGPVLRDAEREAAQGGRKHGHGAARAGEVIVQMHQPALAHPVGHDAGFGEVGELAEEGGGPGRPGSPGQTQGTPPTPRGIRQQARVGSKQAADGGRQNHERRAALRLLRIVHGFGGICEPADAEGLDVESLLAQGRHLAVDEDERGKSQVFPGHIGDARARRAVHLSGRSIRLGPGDRRKPPARTVDHSRVEPPFVS
jgi:hypothetical protein